MELREKIAGIVHRHKLKGSDAVAAMILELPEIREALEISAAFPENDFRDYLLRRGRWEGVSSEAGYT